MDSLRETVGVHISQRQRVSLAFHALARVVVVGE